MPVPIALRSCVEFLARGGIGWEDICLSLKVPRELRDDVRRLVLGFPTAPVVRGRVERVDAAGSDARSTVD